MLSANSEITERLFTAIAALPAFDAHTHIQDDLLDFDRGLAEELNLSGTQSSFNCLPDSVIAEAIASGRLVRRTMADPTHALFYSWFAEIAEGSRGRLDSVIEQLGSNSEKERRAAGRGLVGELGSSAQSEYCDWIRQMFASYGIGNEIDALDPKKFDVLCEAVAARRGNPDFAQQILADANITGYVTSLENRDKIPVDHRDARPAAVDLTYATHPEVYHMADLHYLFWPGGATDFGLFLGGHKGDATGYLLNLERRFGRTLDSADSLRNGVEEFLRAILWSPQGNPDSRVRYANTFQPLDFRFSGKFDQVEVEAAIRHHKGELDGAMLAQVIAFVTAATLETLDDIGREMRAADEEFGACLQIAVGVDYFMDGAREIQSLPRYATGFPQDEYAVWARYPNIQFEYIVSHEMLYRDLAAAAKQVGNISVGPWWHLFRKRAMRRLFSEQLSMGPVSSIACGFTDARFVEMAAAKYRSLRRAIAGALGEFVADPDSWLFGKEDRAIELAAEMLFDRPRAVHHIP
ncbi:MAG: hypothetical protein ACI9R3_000527 [Verrucomicrobiales bacterium]|jgi:hypothetical protein